ncbi:putative BED zinc finger-containing protein [Homarus americanus]|uniref:Putative BED zinc finger-containing protein n=1 Tax=Homarus americanus TaxID=6706 RepID=A0A8J5J904_HOMAM|nr:putative BED zinc finger-containing protein [Homarus americanus]
MDNESMSGSTSIPPDTVNLSTNTGVGGGVREMGSVGMSGSTRRTSRVWRYFGMVDNCHYICRLCSFVGAYTNTTNMRKHIQHHHPERFQDILDHTRPSTRPFYVGSIPRMRPPQHFTQQQTSPYPGGLVYPHTLPGLAAPEDHGSSDFSHNNGDEVPVAVSPELFLAESNERESTPAPPTPTPQKPESYQLRHNNHLTIVLEALARDESFMDVTLTAQGRSLKAHKVQGEMTVAAEDLTSLLKTAEILQVSGLAPSDSSATVNPHTESSTAGNARSSSASSSSSSSNLPSVSKTSRMVKTSTQQTTTPPARPKSRDSMINPTDFMDVDMTCVKEEVQSADEEESEEQVTKESSSQPPGGGMKGDQTLQHSLTTFSPSFDPDLEQPTASTSSSQDISPTTLPIKSDPETEINPLGTVGTEDPHPFMCPHCQEHHRDMDTMITHLRVRHPTKPSFTCGCGRVYTRQMLHQAHARMCSSLS